MNDLLIWLSMNVPTIIITLLIAAVVIAAVIYIIRRKKRGGCSCGCSGCDGKSCNNH